MTLEFFIHAALAGLLATYCHMIAAVWVAPLGLPRLDLPRAIANFTFGESFDHAPSYWAGQMVIYLNGIVFALIYATLVGPLLPGPDFARGISFGFGLFVFGGLLFAPIFLRDGVFMSRVHPRAWMTALIIHIVWGVVIGWLSPVLP